MKTRLGCLTLPGITAIISAILIFGGITLFRGGVLFSPGSLSARRGEQELGGVLSHADLKTNCAACHPAPWQAETMTGRCVACHTNVSQDPQNFHRVILLPNDSCRRCHREHRGATASVTVMDLRLFPHETVGYSLKAHQKTTNGTEFKCSDCHEEKVSSFDLWVCSSCHSQIDSVYMERHTLDFGRDCLACHDGLDRFGEFTHSEYAFPLTGKHENAGCSGCHKSVKNLLDLQSAPQDCFSCHVEDDSHMGRMGKDCGSCHSPEDWTLSSFDHSSLAFPLIGKHKSVACQDCHLDEHLQATPQDCWSCHGGKDPHQGQLGQECDTCHTPEGWNRAAFDHSTSAFPLTGKHVGADCAACHPDLQFKGTPINCFACHAGNDVHGGQFGTDCAACHTPSGWIPANFDHKSFPLTGGHAGLACVSCHTDGSFQGTLNACSTCHTEPTYHTGLFGNSCNDCHSTTGWLPAQFNLAHTFPRNHGETNNTCRTCHPSQLSQYTCYTCHASGEIREKHIDEGIRDFQNCMQCHPDGREGND